MIKKAVIFFIISYQIFQISAQELKNLTITIVKLPTDTSLNSSLFLAGDFKKWLPNSSGSKFKLNGQAQWQLTLLLPAGEINYKITKGSWNRVECDGLGNAIANRSLYLKNDTSIYLSVAGFNDEFEFKPIKSTASKHVKVLDSAFYIPQLGVYRKIWIYIPPSYYIGKKNYPVMYAHDGQNLFDKLSSGFGEWGIDEVLDSIFISDKKESIIIGIYHGGNERLLEYNPYDSKFGTGKGDKYVDFIVATLKPFIDSKYRTLKERKSTAIIGSSMGGLISMYAAIKYPKTFGYVGVFSPAFWIAPQLYQDIEKSPLNKKTKFYFMAGEKESKDMVSDMQKMYDLLLLKGYPAKNLKFVTKPDGQHSEWFWRREFPDFMKFLGGN